MTEDRTNIATDTFERALAKLMVERVRQFQKWGEQKHSPEIWLAILLEEIGEFSKAVMEARFRGRFKERIGEELTQVVAVAFAMLEDWLRRGDEEW